ncbi:hypothetical protein EV589_4553 [Mycobacterium sp. BK558]|uniref:Uncharacterized protein n=1 Tax=Mycolicibacterium chlorophenolicum TaxID=37916 RepID=A0A0J6W9B0_9MYCO|nr:hypothetical protein [Mycolicibacterium chlorophenolicum]KMO78478.1 hypothetical protein MCHLDSM_02395 [Mycolicibacterium chlorophenolicum]RZT13843.1 hypothetical protein EV589_4553 [Mycobacterium sp. BK558]
MNQPENSDTANTDPTDDHGAAPRYDERLPLADQGRSEVMARLRERFSFSG